MSITRYRIDLAFHGAEFHGWQRQPGLRTVQGELETWFTRLLRSSETVRITGAGRTDAGVHAEHMVAHFDSAAAFDPVRLVSQLAAALPQDVCVRRLTPVAVEFHARYSAVAKTYLYRLCTVQTPFDRDRRWHILGSFDLQAAISAAAKIRGTHDFSGFCRAASHRPTMTCDVHQSEWQRTEDGYTYRVRANRFLHGMVRLLVGTMADIARGRWPDTRIDDILRSGDVRLSGTAAPAHGLTLIEIEYPIGA